MLHAVPRLAYHAQDGVSCYVFSSDDSPKFSANNLPEIWSSFTAGETVSWDWNALIKSSDCSAWFLTTPLMILILKCLQHSETAVHLQEVFKYMNIKSLAISCRNKLIETGKVCTNPVVTAPVQKNTQNVAYSWMWNFKSWSNTQQKLTVPQLVKKFPTFYRSWRFITMFTWSCH